MLTFKKLSFRLKTREISKMYNEESVTNISDLKQWNEELGSQNIADPETLMQFTNMFKHFAYGQNCECGSL
jgi:hypothetical protein